MKKFEIEIPEGKRAEWKEVDGQKVLALVDEVDDQSVSALVDEVDNRHVTEYINKFEDALYELGKRAKSNEGIAILLADFESNEFSHICFKNRELADYFGKQFIDIWADYVFQKQVNNNQ